MKIREMMETLQLNKLLDKGERKYNQLMTPWGEQIAQEQTEIVLTEYPRPQMARKNHIILNGIWKYAFTRDDERPVLWDGDIRVPFSPETYLSGVQRQLGPDEYLWYERKLIIDRIPMEKRLLLNFGACDERCRIYVNDTLAGTHSGGYQAFTIDITDCIQVGKNTLRLCVQDKSDTSYHGRGKQMLNNGGMFYTAQSGLWQTVWCEWVPAIYIQELRITPDYDNDSVSVEITSNKHTDSRTGQSYRWVFRTRKAGHRSTRFYMISVLYMERIWWKAILACASSPQSRTAAESQGFALTTSPISRKESLTRAIIPKAS